MVKENCALAIDLYKQLAPTQGNLLFSPWSLEEALIILCLGARGETQKEIGKTLHFSSLSLERLKSQLTLLKALKQRREKDQAFFLRISNSLWYQANSSLQPDFKNLINQYSEKILNPVDFKNGEIARNLIKVWIASSTEDMLFNVIPGSILDERTRLILINAVCFKGKWANQFKKHLSQKGLFWLTSDTAIEMDFMKQTQTFSYKETDEGIIVELPYIDGKFSMLILLPTQRHRLEKLEKVLTLQKLAKWRKKMKKKRIQLSLPRFRLDCQLNLENTLIEMGIKDAFNPDKANFSGIDGGENGLYISKVLHQALIDVNEEGSRAVAATLIEEKETGIFSPTAVVNADHPFVFLITENSTETILFLGRCVNPLQLS